MIGKRGIARINYMAHRTNDARKLDDRIKQRALSLCVNRQPPAPGLHGPNSRTLGRLVAVWLTDTFDSDPERDGKGHRSASTPRQLIGLTDEDCDGNDDLSEVALAKTGMCWLPMEGHTCYRLAHVTSGRPRRLGFPS